MVSRDLRKGTFVAALLSLVATSCAAAQEASVAPTVPTTNAIISTNVDSPADAAHVTEPTAPRVAVAPAPTPPQVATSSSSGMDVTPVSDADSVAAERRSVEALDRVATVLPVQHEKRGAVITLSTDDLFEPGESRLSSRANPRLDQIASALRLQGDKTIEIDGFTDSLGDAAENDHLSTGRADALRDYFASKGVDASKIRTEGMGSRRPVADNATPYGRAQNRRLEVVIANAPSSGSGSRGVSSFRTNRRPPSS